MLARPVDDAVVFLDRGRSHRGERLAGRRIDGADHGRSARARLAPSDTPPLIWPIPSLGNRSSNIGWALDPVTAGVRRVGPTRPCAASRQAPATGRSCHRGLDPHHSRTAGPRDRLSDAGHASGSSPQPESELQPPAQRVDSTHLLASQLVRVTADGSTNSPGRPGIPLEAGARDGRGTNL